MRRTGVLVLGGVLGACGTSSPPSGAASADAAGPLTVLAAASLTEAFQDGAGSFERAHPGLSVRFSFAGSPQLVRAVSDGAPADVVATADGASMTRLMEAGLVDRPRTFARNRLEIAVAPGDPRGVRGLADLARPDLAVVLADPAVPAGGLARQALRRAHVAVAPRSNELDVKAALRKVESGDADAAIVYATDVSAAVGRVGGVAIPDAENVTSADPIAVTRSSRRPRAAAAFVDEAVAGGIQAALRRRGFAAP